MEKENKYYFKVVAKCGHVGRNKYIPIQFAVEANSAKEAANIVRYFPRVKHDHEDAIMRVEKIDKKEYKEIISINKKDPYLHCGSKYEQKQITDLQDRLVDDLLNIKRNYHKDNKRENASYKQKKQRLVEKSDWEDYYGYSY